MANFLRMFVAVTATKEAAAAVAPAEKTKFVNKLYENFHLHMGLRIKRGHLRVPRRRKNNIFCLSCRTKQNKTIHHLQWATKYKLKICVDCFVTEFQLQSIDLCCIIFYFILT